MGIFSDISPTVRPGFMQGMADANALSAQNIENQINKVKAQYAPQMVPAELAEKQAQADLTRQQAKFYEPNIQSEIGYRNALASGVPSEIQQRLAEVNKLNTMTPLEAQKLKLENDWYPKLTQAEINMKNMGGANAPANVKNLFAFTRQLMADNPINKGESTEDYQSRINQMQNSYLSDSDTLPNGQPLPELTGTGSQLLLDIQGRNVPAQLKNQFAQVDSLYNDLKDFDIDSVKAFAGIRGRAKLLEAKAKMAKNPDDPSIDPLARRYLMSMQNALINMDQMRKAFGTSVVPDYVYATIGKLTNPNSDMYLDPKQVEMNFNAVTKQIKSHRDLLRTKVRHGVTADSSSEKPSSTSGTHWVYNASTGKLEAK